MSQREILLRIAATLPQPFTREQLVVACWEAAPEVFGLWGTEYPDSHKVQYVLYGHNGPLKIGQLLKCEGGFRVPEKLPSNGELPPWLRRLMNIEAFINFHSGGKDALSFRSAMEFWGVTDRTPRGEYKPIIDDLTAYLRQLDTPESRQVLHCHLWLADKFSRHLGLIGERASRGAAVQG